MKIDIVEVGPRDGLQNEAQHATVAQRLQLVNKLVEAGLKRIEVGAFVSPKWVPQMAGTAELCHELFANSKNKTVKFSVLVPNLRGLEDALDTQVKEVAVFGACSESFSQKNINCSIAESLTRFKEIITVAKKKKVRVRGYLSTVFGCPYEGKVPFKRVLDLSEKMLDLGVYELSLGDTIGVATPKQVRDLLKQFKKRLGLRELAMHFHDTRGTALANILASLDAGVKVFDSSVGGLGGCPYAAGASGNLATEDLVYMLEGMGVKTGVDLEKLVQMRELVESITAHPVVGRVSRAGLPKKAQ